MATRLIQPPYYPIIYVRGYAATGSSVEQTVATPYMGFNRGSTKIRQRWTGEVVRHIFESPLIRLMKDHGYQDAYHEGDQFGDGRSVGGRSVFVYRYYDQVSGDLGTGERPEIETYAQGLSDFILRVRDAVCGDDPSARSACRVYLVAHSLGGLICRCFLQNPRIGTDVAKRLVDKVFTYATPHNGIDLNVIGNVPGIFGLNNANSFNHARMAEYLDLAGEPSRVDELGGRFDPKRFFCLVGTNDRDDESAGGWARRVVGPMSDGLVRIKNASVRNAPRAFVYRSHSGDYGIVNSEEGYQNLVRFLFGDVRVDGKLVVHDLRLPWALQRAFDRGKTIRASYHFEVVIRTRGASWDLHRRTVAEHSAIFRRFDEMLRGPDAESQCPYLFSTFLSARARVNSRRSSLGFSVDLGVLVPHYEIDNALWFDDHYDGGYLFRDKLNFQITRTAGPAGQWTLRYGLDSRTPNRATRRVEPAERDGAVMFAIPIQQRSRPGIDAELQLIARSWNH